MSTHPASVKSSVAPLARKAQFASMTLPDIDLSKLTIEERLALMSRICDSIREEEFPDSTDLAAELRRRIALADAAPDGGLDAFEALADLRQRVG